MAIIYSYPLNDNIKPLDELVGTTEHNINGQLKTVTRNFLLSDLAEFFIVDGGIQKTITLTTSGSSGPATLNQLTGVLNIPQYSGGGGSQNLQQVTDIGNTTNNQVLIPLLPVEGDGISSRIALEATNTDFDTNSQDYIGIGIKGSGATGVNGNGIGIYSVGVSAVGGDVGFGVTAFGGIYGVYALSNEGTGVYATSNQSYGIYAFSNFGVGIGTLSNEGPGIIADSNNSVAGIFNINNESSNIVAFQKDFVTKAYVTYEGDFTGNKFVKIGGLSTQYLMADGSVTTVGPGGSQNLQQVLDTGNTTDTGIIMNIANTQGVLINLSQYSIGLNVSTVGGEDLSYPIFLNNDYAPYFQVDSGGNLFSVGSLEAYSFVKSGGLPTEYLMADGSVTTGGGGSSPLTAKGDLYTFSTVDARLPVGIDGQILTANSSVPEGLSWQDNYADWTSTVKHIVKNNGLSGTITKGTAVYVTGSNGTNMLVGRASNVSEPTSSKTMGLMQSDITTSGVTQTGFVITEGLLGGLNTAGATGGDPVWLGVDGALIYGLINKPFAPNHLVFIGIVTKVSAGNGEIFVKVQNGFELKELHDVQAQSPTLKDTLYYDNTVTPAQWKTASLSTILGYTPANDLNVVHLSGTETITGFKTFTGGIDVALSGNAVKANSGQALALDVIGGNNSNAIAKFTRVSDSVEVVRIDNNGLKLQLQTINTIAGIDSNKNIISLPTTTYPSLVELSYVKGVTSAIQTQLNSKSTLASPTFTGTVVLPSTTSIGDVSSIEIGYLDNVTSSIQTQLDNKIAKNIATTYTTNTITTVTAAEYAAIGTKDPNTLYFII